MPSRSHDITLHAYCFISDVTAVINLVQILILLSHVLAYITVPVIFSMAVFYLLPCKLHSMQ